MTTKLKRVFKVGAMKLDDPCPGGNLEESIRLLCRNYPQFRVSRLYESDGVVKGNELVYELKTPPAKVNG